MTDPLTLDTGWMLMDMNIRCHWLAEDWFHATMPTVGEVLATGDDSRKAVALVDKHMLISQSSFGPLASASDIPFSLFQTIVLELLSSGAPVKPDGSCHTKRP